MPDQIMNSATRQPIYPSICRPVNFTTRTLTRTALVAITSFLLSAPVAIRVSELIFLPMLILKRDCHSLTAMAMTRVMMVI